VLLYVLPLVFAFSGVNFPIGVLLYWTTTNLWSMGQQFYTIRRMPTPGSEAERRLKERRARKGIAEPEVTGAGGTTVAVADPAPKGQRQQPVGKARAKAKTPPPTRPGGKPTAGTTPSAAPKPVSGTKPNPAGKAGAGKAAGGKGGAARSTTPRPSGSTAMGAGGDGRTTPPAERARKRTGDGGGDAAPSPSQPTN